MKRDSACLSADDRERLGEIIDEDPGRSEAFSRMKQAGLDTRSFTLPVVDVNAEILVQPESPAVIAKYRL